VTFAVAAGRSTLEGQGSKNLSAPTEFFAADGRDNYHLYVTIGRCPAPECGRLRIDGRRANRLEIHAPAPSFFGLLWPRFPTAAPVHESVPEYIRVDFAEATACLAVSHKASAALSRRCMQSVLHAHGFKAGTLRQEIEDALPSLPAYIQDSMHDIRRLGNLGAHPKSDDAGSIVDVEEHEARWMLLVVEQLFDHYYTRPAVAAKQRAALNAKDPNSDPALQKPKQK